MREILGRFLARLAFQSQLLRLAWLLPVRLDLLSKALSVQRLIAELDMEPVTITITTEHLLVLLLETSIFKFHIQ